MPRDAAASARASAHLALHVPGRLTEIAVTVTDPRAALAAPMAVLMAADGRAVAWYDGARPFVVHPSLTDLLTMHGLARAGLALAA